MTLDIASLVPIIVALIAGGAVALYTARPKKDSIIAEASERAIGVVTKAIEQLEGELKEARETIAELRFEIKACKETIAMANRTIELMVRNSRATDSSLSTLAKGAVGSEHRIQELRDEIHRLTEKEHDA